MTTVFLDRDGVINENRSDYVKSWSEFQFLPGVLEAIARLTGAGHRIFVCTNQAGVARGCMRPETVEEIHLRMMAEVAQYGGLIEKVFYCPHGKEESCPCRKPQPGLLFQARDEFALDLACAVFVGDCITDVRAALAAGVQPLLVLSGLGAEQLRTHGHEVTVPFSIRLNLPDAVEAIMHHQHAARDVREGVLFPLLL